MNFSKADIPFQVVDLINTLQMNNFEGWLVGGAIRTLMLGKIPQDWDVTTNATPTQVQKIFPHTIETGLAYGTITVVIDQLFIQVTTFRKESEYENHRKPREISFCKTIEEDLARRDFTINAMAFNPVTNVIVDPFNGQDDLSQQIIKAVGEPNLRFQEDALRIMRAIRFQSQLGFLIEENTLDAMASSGNLLVTLSRERIGEEFSKWLLGSFFSMTKSTAQKIDFFRIFEVLPSSNFFKNWDQISTIESKLIFRLCAFFCSYTDGLDQNYAKDNSLKLLRSLKYGHNVISKVIQFIEFLSKVYDVDVKIERHFFLNQALEIGFKDAISLLDWKLQQKEDKLLLLKDKNMLEILRLDDFEIRVFPLAIDGNKVMQILNLPPGPKVKVVLEELRNLVLDDPNLNSATELEKYVNQRRLV